MGEGPKITIPHCVAVALELMMLGAFVYEGSVSGIIISLIYGYRFSATASAIIILMKEDE